MAKRASFGSKIGAILVAAGSAIGLGSIWRFPYMTGENGGGAFLIVYLFSVLVVGIPVMLAEFAVGTYTRKSPVRAYNQLSPRWKWLGYNSVIVSLLISGFYYIVAGWSLEYFISSANGVLYSVGDFAQHFAAFTGSWREPIYTVVFVLLTHAIVIMGVQEGLERISKIVMPILLLMLVVLVIHSATMSGAAEGYQFLFKPDFSKVDSGVFLSALGQAFFSLSLGTACLCTYASYFGKQTNLIRSASQIALIDSMIAILAGLMIFPAAFSVGVSPDSGPSLIFITLPSVFQQAFAAVPMVGYVISILFYALLALAAITSTISMHEIGTVFFHEQLKLSRKSAAAIVTVVAGMICVFCSLSVGACDGLQLFGMSLMDFFDFLTAQIMLPVGALLTCVYVGWVAPRKVVQHEFASSSNARSILFTVYLFAARFVCPVCIILIFLNQFGVI